jgi:hypothetical protein
MLLGEEFAVKTFFPAAECTFNRRPSTRFYLSLDKMPSGCKMSPIPELCGGHGSKFDWGRLSDLLAQRETQRNKQFRAGMHTSPVGHPQAFES